MADPNDLCTAAYATGAVLAGGVTLSTNQLAILPTLITAASKEIIRYCGRPFALQSFDEIITPEGGRQDRGEPASAKLTYFPVQSLSRVYTGRATALTISNTDQVDNQVATVAFAASGDVEFLDLVYTGLVVSALASGAPISTTLEFATFPTVRALAGAVNALGSGWRAVVASGGPPDVGLFPSADLVGAREPKNAFGPGAGLDLFTQAASGFDVDRTTGILRVYGSGGFGYDLGGGWGDPFGASWDGLGDYGGGMLGWSQYRVSYSAGWTTIPEPIAQVCAEVVKASIERLNTDSMLQSESVKDHTWSARELILTLPDWAAQVLAYYKDWRV